MRSLSPGPMRYSGVTTPLLSVPLALAAGAAAVTRAGGAAARPCCAEAPRGVSRHATAKPRHQTWHACFIEHSSVLNGRRALNGRRTRADSPVDDGPGHGLALQGLGVERVCGIAGSADRDA